MWIHTQSAASQRKAPKRITINDKDREEHINNDEGLYHMQRRSGLSMRAFIRANRAELDKVINKILGQEN